MRRWGFLLLAACAPGSELKGHVTFVSGDAAQVLVSLLGPTPSVVSVDAKGDYAASGLWDGRYTLQANAPWAVTPASVSVRVLGPTQAPDLALSGAGQILGTVTAPGGGAGAVVKIEGSALWVTAARDGTFAFPKAPAGPQVLTASLPGWEPASALATVPYAATAVAVLIDIAYPAHGPGSVAGRARYFNRPDDSGIRVSVEGTDLSTATAADGSYSMTGLPLGTANLLFSAPGYGLSRMDALAVGPAPVAAPDVTLYLAESRFRGPVAGLSLSPTGARALFVGGPTLYALDLSSDVPALALGAVEVTQAPAVSWQPEGERAVARVGGSLFAVDVGAATLLSRHAGTDPSEDAQVAAGRVFFVESGSVRMFDFDAGVTTTLGTVGPAPACAEGSWSPGSFPRSGHVLQVSGDGAVGFVSPGAVVVFDGHEVATFPWVPSCLGWVGGQLVGAVPNGAGANLVQFGADGGVLLGAGAGFQAGFSGDGAHAWMVDPAEQYVLTVAALGGAGRRVIYASPTAFSVLPQPGGGQLAILGQGARTSLQWMDLAGTLLGSYTPTQPSYAVGSAFFSPQGRWLVSAFSTDLSMMLWDAASHTAITLPGVPLSFGTYPLESVLTEFGPGDGALAFATQAQGCQERLLSAGGQTLATSSVGCPYVAEWVEYDPSGRWAILGNETVTDLSSGTTVPLGQRAWPLANGQSRFVADGSRLVFGDGNGRVFTADPATGVATYVADADGSAFLPVPGSRALLIIETPAANVVPVQPPGIYELHPP